MYQFIPAALQTGGGLFQTIGAGRRTRRAEKALEGYADSYKPNESIMDYYNKAYAKYNPNAYQSSAYNAATNQINRNLATGINASQDRRGGLANISSLVQGSNDASRRAVVDAENQQRQDLSMLGNASSKKASEQRYKFELKYNLLAQKAAQAAKKQNDGLQNIFGGLSNASMVAAKGDGDSTSSKDPYTGVEI